MHHPAVGFRFYMILALASLLAGTRSMPPTRSPEDICLRSRKVQDGEEFMFAICNHTIMSMFVVILNLGDMEMGGWKLVEHKAVSLPKLGRSGRIWP